MGGLVLGLVAPCALLYTHVGVNNGPTTRVESYLYYCLSGMPWQFWPLAGAL